MKPGMQCVRTHESRVSCHCFPSLFGSYDITVDVVLAQFAVRLAVRLQHIVQDLPDASGPAIPTSGPAPSPWPRPPRRRHQNDDLSLNRLWPAIAFLAWSVALRLYSWHDPGRPRAHPPGRTARRAVVRRRPGHGPADGARPAPVPDLAAASRADGLGRGRPGGRVLHVPGGS